MSLYCLIECHPTLLTADTIGYKMVYSFSEKVKYMSNAAANALATLGLSAPATDANGAPLVTETVVVETRVDVAPVTETVADGAAAPVADASTEADEASFTAGTTVDLGFDEVPATERGFSSTKTKYGFEDIAAPGENGNKYNGKLVPFEGGDEDKFKRSVQSGATGQNSKAKDAGAPHYYVTRAAEKEGKFIGLYIIRTDERPVKKEEAAPAAAEGTTAE